MKTTLDLPEDVADLLRMESAKRGGRKKASLSKLVTDAVRMVYATGAASHEPDIDFHPGRVVVRKAKHAPELSTEDVNHVLWDEA